MAADRVSDLEEQVAALQALVAGQIAPPAPPVIPVGDPVDGFARCMNPACVVVEPQAEGPPLEYRTPDRPIRLVKTTMETRAPDFKSLVLATTHHIALLDDNDAHCPECGFPCAILDGVEPSYPRMAPA